MFRVLGFSVWGCRVFCLGFEVFVFRVLGFSV